MAPATLKAGRPMAQAREGQAAVRLADGRVLVMGGTTPFVGKCAMACTVPATASVEVYDPKTGRFSHNGSLAAPAGFATAVLLKDGRVLVEGGWYGGPGQSMEIYDPAAGRSTVVELPPDIESLPAEAAFVGLADGRVLIAGGTYDFYNSTSNTTLIFDPASGKFTPGPLMAKPRAEATASLLPDGRVLILGGVHFEGNYGYGWSDAEVLVPSRPLVKSTLLAPAAPLVPVPPEAPVALSDGRVLVVASGSYDDGTGCSAPAVPQVFDPGSGEFGTVGPMVTPRSGAAAVRVGDGRVLFFGGVDARCAPLGTVEAFDPESGTFQVISTAFPKISGFSVSLLNDGEVLIAGGGDSQWNGMTAKTWLLKP
jgi:hypothetical protein